MTFSLIFAGVSVVLGVLGMVLSVRKDSRRDSVSTNGINGSSSISKEAD